MNVGTGEKGTVGVGTIVGMAVMACGGVVWPAESLPQHATDPSDLKPQVCKNPAGAD